jgi:hypothetical protein
MKNQSKMNQGIIGIISLVIIAGIIYFLSHKQKEGYDTKIEYIEEHGVYSIGRVIEYSTTNEVNLGMTGFIRISYIINDKISETSYNSSDYPVPIENGPEIGKEYMVIYLPNEPEKCAMLFNYPIKDSLDYKRYLEEFKINRPKLERGIRTK